MDPNHDELLAPLNAEQREAVTAPAGPLLILAGAGTGKTRVLTHRIAYQIAAGNAAAHQVLALTFTNKAAAEMASRIDRLLQDDGTGAKVWRGTYHRFGYRFLQTYGHLVGLPTPTRDGFAPTILDPDAQRPLLRAAITQIGVQPADLVGARPGKDSPLRAAVTLAQETIDSWKSTLSTPDELLARAADARELALAFVWAEYERLKDRAAALDFGDLIVKPARLLAESPNLRAQIGRRFTAVFADEYQDTDLAQYHLLNALASEHDNLTVVADDRQTIYSFRGAEPANIPAFFRDHPGARRVVLDHNYRSSQLILDAASALIAPNPSIAPLHLWTSVPDAEPLELLVARDPVDEAERIAALAAQLVADGLHPQDICVLVRTNNQRRPLEAALLAHGVPCDLGGSTEFFRLPEVRDLLAYLHVVANPYDLGAFRRAAAAPSRGIGSVTLDTLQRAVLASPADRVAIGEVARDPSIQATLPAATRPRLTAFLGLLDELRHAAENLPASEWLALAAERTGYLASLEAQPERAANVHRLFDLAAALGGPPGLPGISAFLEHAALQTTQPGDRRDATPVITIHQAKGCEWPVVVLAGFEEGVLPFGISQETTAAEIAEERRIAYVGCTRAQELLVLSYAAARTRADGSLRRSAPSRFLEDIPAEVFLDLRTHRASPAVDTELRPSLEMGIA